ncbi:MAG TPA: hypothetical protein VLF63_02775 [Patescibacteria group bacterium]|nr:hypothetical protein [Patescibacteria group bacterium]
MSLTKNYLHDHFILLLASVNFFLSLSGFLYILIKLFGINHANGYIVQYRPELGVGSYQTGGIEQLIGFSLFAIIILVIGLLLSYRVYKIHRQLAIVILFLGILLLTLNIIIGNALIKLR